MPDTADCTARINYYDAIYQQGKGLCWRNRRLEIILRKPAWHDDPTKLSGLKQAAYVLGCLQEGLSEEAIGELLKSDPQLVRMWISFLIHNHWVENFMDDFDKRKWIVTDKGDAWIEKCYTKQLPLNHGPSPSRACKN